MLIDANQLGADHVAECDLCIVGGGMAGVAMARELASTKLAVCVLESGGEDLDARTQALYEGEARLEDSSGASRDLGNYLSASRFRFLGGSGNAWGAKCGPLDGTDFERRAWIPDSGWPFGRDHLAPFYDRACDVLKIRRFDYDPATEFDRGRPPLSLAEGEWFTTATRHLSPVRSSATGEALREYRRSLTEASSVRVYLHANVIELECSSAGNAIASVLARTLDGPTFRVRARHVVLAAGGIENARLLLLSDTRHASGIGNQHDLVGRFFSGHTTADLSSRVAFTHRRQSLDLYTTRDPGKVWGVFALSRAAQTEFELGNFTVTLGAADGRLPPEDADALAAMMAVDQRREEGDRSVSSMLPLYFMTEQAPNAESRVTLTEQRDALGQRKARLTWRYRAEDKASLQQSARLFARDLGRTASGRLHAALDEVDWLEVLQPSRHHIGTTRMHESPRNGVVDADCKVHGVDNLFVAGSSVFPTSGIANPTLTLIALALRLCDHLKLRLAGGPR